VRRVIFVQLLRCVVPETSSRAETTQARAGPGDVAARRPPTRWLATPTVGPVLGRTLLQMSGLHLVLLKQAHPEGLPLAKGHAVPWLSARGHLNPLAAEADSLVLEALGSMHSALAGDAQALAAKRPGNPPTPISSAQRREPT
jgi:hypothetical protein